MGIIYPNQSIEKRWRGALTRRLRQAPLEAFLTARQLPLAQAGTSQVADNLSCATVHLVEAAIGGASDLFVFNRLREAVAGPLACAVSQGVADAIDESASWRIAAMVSTTELLAPRIGFAFASQRAVAAAYAYIVKPLDAISSAAAQAVKTQQTRGLVRLIMRELPDIALSASRSAAIGSAG